MGRLQFHFIYEPFSIEKGVFRSDHQETTHFKDFLVTLSGPLASLLFAGLFIYFAVFSGFPEMIKMAFYILTGSCFLDFWYNIQPNTTPVKLHDNVLVYNSVSNSTPVYTLFPPLFLCAGNFFTFDHSLSFSILVLSCS